MRKIFVELDKAGTISLGRQGEKNAAVVIWDISKWEKSYGKGKATLLYTLEGAENTPYPCQVQVIDGQARWLITPTELMLASFGKCQLVYCIGDEIVVKSPVYQTRVQVSLGEKTTQPPESFTGWVDEVLAAGSLADEAVKQLDDMIRLPSVTEQDNGKVLTVVDGKWIAQMPTADSWKDVQNMVRLGLAPQYFPVGYEFITHDSVENTDIVWRVVGYDTIKAVDTLCKHTMVLETKYVYSNSAGSEIAIQFDAPEALYYAQNGLAAGTYHFTLPAGYEETYGGGKTYSFTLTKSIPAGGVVMLPWGYNQQVGATSIYTFATQADTNAIETVGIAEAAEGMNLGTADGNTFNMNHVHRIRYGSNNYAQSAVRQWLNSRENAGNVWLPQTKFDRPPSWCENRAGFLRGLPEDFLSVVQTAIVLCQTNSVYETENMDSTIFSVNQSYQLNDQFFLLSQPEIYGIWDSSSHKDGEQLEFYTGLTDSEKIKYDHCGVSRSCWLRNPSLNSAITVRTVNTLGMMYSGNANNASGITPACIIA